MEACWSLDGSGRGRRRVEWSGAGRGAELPRERDAALLVADDCSDRQWLQRRPLCYWTLVADCKSKEASRADNEAGRESRRGAGCIVTDGRHHRFRLPSRCTATRPLRCCAMDGGCRIDDSPNGRAETRCSF